MRKKQSKKRPLIPDPKFHDQLVTRCVNNLMLQGKKSTAYKVNNQVNKVASKAQDVKNNSLDQLNGIINDFRNFAARAISFLQSIGKYFAEAMQSVINAITSIGKQSLAILTTIMNNVKKMFQNLGKGLVTAIINPFLSLFSGLKTIFAGIFGVLMTVVEKIMSLTNCFPIYLFDGIKRMVSFFYNAITPKFLKVIFSFIFNYMIYPMLYISYYIFLYIPLMIIEFFTGVNIEKGLRKSTSKCMKFDIKKPVQQMEDGSKKLIPQFKPLNVDFKVDISKQTRKINSTLNDAVKQLDPSNMKF